MTTKQQRDLVKEYLTYIQVERGLRVIRWKATGETSRDWIAGRAGLGGKLPT